MTTAKTPNPQSRFRLPDPPPREPDEVTAFDHVYKHGNNRYLAIHLGNQDTTLVVADRWIIAHPDADRSRARRPDLLIAFNVDPAAYHASNGYIVSEQGKPPDFVLEVASESTGAPTPAPSARTTPPWAFPNTGASTKPDSTTAFASPATSLSATDTNLSPSSNCPTAPCKATALRSTYSCTGRTASYSGSTQRRSSPSSPTRTSYPAPNRPLPAPSRPLPASANSRTKSAASGDNNPEHRIRLDSWRRWSTSDPKVADLGANSANAKTTQLDQPRYPDSAISMPARLSVSRSPTAMPRSLSAASQSSSSSGSRTITTSPKYESDTLNL